MKTLPLLPLLLTLSILGTYPSNAQEPPPPPPPPPGEPALPSELEILAFVEANLPDTFQQLQDIQRQDPAFYHHEVRMLGHLVLRYRELEGPQPRLAAGLLRAHRLDRQCEQIADKIRQTPDAAEKAQLKQKLQGILSEIFELRIAERELDVKNLERELNHIQTLLQTRRQAKDQIIERRLRDLSLDGDDALGWW